MKERAIGILLHIASLPSRYGIGTFGKKAYDFVNILATHGIKYWQVLPLVQTGYGDSPYQAVYSGAGNPYFIDLECLVKDGLLKKNELAICRNTKSKIDYAFLYQNKYKALRQAYKRFDVKEKAFIEFVKEDRFNAYALFMTIKEKFNQISFDQWPSQYKLAQKRALKKIVKENREEYTFWLFLQYKFFKQWNELKKYANEKGIEIIGDIPLYVAYDSVDVWLNPELFKLNSDRSLKKVAGVPPDYFSVTGQLWGNPVYKWSAHRKNGYLWWKNRFRQAFEMYDVVRVDHFRGFDRYYEIDASEKTAEKGKWKRGPQYEFFLSIEKELGRLRIIAEDLGKQDLGVQRLMEKTGYPGMKVIQFAFDGNTRNPYLPKNICENSVCYTGTHDNDTMLGYIKSMNSTSYSTFCSNLNKVGLKSVVNIKDKKAIAKNIVFIALNSPSYLTIIPLQDILLLDSRARMNTPSLLTGNWQFKLYSLPDSKVMDEFTEMVKKTHRYNSF